MRMLPAWPWLICLLLATVSTGVGGQTPIHRCLGADGNPVFTDQPCAALDATPVNRPGVASRTAPAVDASPATLCAANAAQLKQAVIDAFASGDANRLAGVMLWGGYGRKAAIADIRALRQAMREPLLDVGTEEASAVVPAATTSIGMPWDAVPPALPAPARRDMLIVHTVGNDGSGLPRAMRFQVVRRSGCLWLRSAN